MKKVIFCTNLPSPYRVDFFNELGKYCDLIVLYERQSSSERNTKWKAFGSENFKEVYLDLKLVGTDRSKGSALKNYVKDNISDILIFTNYVSPATMEAIVWCRFHGRKYYIEYDGGFNKKDSFLKGLLKKFLLKPAAGHLTTADEHIKYLKSIGIKEGCIHKYPFTSIKQVDIDNAKEREKKGKHFYRELLGIKETQVVIAVGRFIHGKGFDVLMKAASRLGENIGVYIIGGEPTEEYIQLKNSLGLDNVHFVGFKTKQELANYYLSADCTAFPTRRDVWGLITNESMAYGVPVVATDMCISALEMIENAKNGYIIPVNMAHELAVYIERTLAKDMKNACRKTAQRYTIEKMAKSHAEYLNLKNDNDQY